MNACTKQCLWDFFFNYYYSRRVAELLETVLNLICGENSSQFGKWAKEMIFVTCLGCFSALAIHLHCPLALLFYVRFRWVMSMRFLTKSVFIPKEKAFSCQLICLFLVRIVSYNLAVANWNLCSVSLICFIICIISHCLCVVFNVSVGLF